jgi:hypothetical protein
MDAATSKRAAKKLHSWLHPACGLITRTADRLRLAPRALAVGGRMNEVHGWNKR